MVNKLSPGYLDHDRAYIEAVVDTFAIVLVAVRIHNVLIIFIDVEVMEAIAARATNIRI